MAVRPRASLGAWSAGAIAFVAAVAAAAASAGCGAPASAYTAGGAHPAGAAAALLAHPDPAQRLVAIAGIERRRSGGSPEGRGGRPDRAVQGALVRMACVDPDPDVRRTAALAAESMTGEPLEALAIGALRKTGDPAIAGGLLENPREAIRSEAVQALRRAGSPEAWRLLAAHLDQEPAPGLRRALAAALGEGVGRGAGAAHGEVLAAIRVGLSDPDGAVRLSCARALAISGDAAGVDVLAAELGRVRGGERRELLALLRSATGEHWR